MDGGGGSGIGIPGPVGRSILFEFPLELDNQGPLGLHVDRVRFGWMQPGVHVDALYARMTDASGSESCDRMGATRFAVSAVRSECVLPTSGLTVKPAGDTNRWIVNFALSVARPGVFRFSGILVDYHIGVLRYRSYQSLSGYLCADADWRTACRHVSL